MHFFKALIGVSALATAAIAQSATLGFTSVPGGITVGKAVAIGYKAPDLSQVRNDHCLGR